MLDPEQTEPPQHSRQAFLLTFCRVKSLLPANSGTAWSSGSASVHVFLAAIAVSHSLQEGIPHATDLDMLTVASGNLGELRREPVIG